MKQLAHKAHISQPLVSNLISNRRVIGEYTAQKLGAALQLSGEEVEELVHFAISNCTEKVLEGSKGYPSRVLNLAAGELSNLGIEPMSIRGCDQDQGGDVPLRLIDGRTVAIRAEVACS